MDHVGLSISLVHLSYLIVPVQTELILRSHPSAMSTLSRHDSSNLLLLSALCILFHILEYVLSFDKVLHHGIEVTILSTFDLLALRFRVHRKHYFLDWMCSLLSIVEEAGTRVVWFWSFPYLVLCLSSELLPDLIPLSRHRTYRTCVRQYV